MTQATHLRQNIASAFKQNLIPGLILQVFALSLALSYFNWEPAHQAFSALGQLKQQYTWRYAMVSTALFGGLLPYLYLLFTGQIVSKKYSLLTFYVVFWALKGLEMDMFYRFQGYLFGTEADIATIAKKTLVDQLLFSAFWAAPSIVLIYLWRDAGFNFRRWWQQATQRSLWCQHIPTVVFSNWIVWFPAAAIVYSMPPALQIPLFNLVLCFFVLLLASLSKSRPTNT